MIDPIPMTPLPTSGVATPLAGSVEGVPFESMLAALAGATTHLNPALTVRDESGDDGEGGQAQSDQESNTPHQTPTTLGDQIAASRLGVMALAAERETTTAIEPTEPTKRATDPPTDPPTDPARDPATEPPTQTHLGSTERDPAVDHSLEPAHGLPEDWEPIEFQIEGGDGGHARFVGGSTNTDLEAETLEAPETGLSVKKAVGDGLALDELGRDIVEAEPDLRSAPESAPIQAGESEVSQVANLQALAGPTLPAGSDDAYTHQSPAPRPGPGPARPQALVRAPAMRDTSVQEGTRQANNIHRSPVGDTAEVPNLRVDHTPATPHDRPDAAPASVSGGQGVARAEVRPPASRMAERIESWVKTTENAPPPRSITLRGAELHGLTIRVSVVHNGLSIQLEGIEGDDVAWMRQVIQNLGDKGFDISEFAEYDSEGERRQLWDEEQADQRRRRPDFDPFLEEQLA